jgi:hypothetical protein
VTWFRVDDGLATHPKPRAAGLTGMGLWVVSGAYAGQQLTDGFVPDWYIESWKDGKKAATSLVKAGLWVPSDEDAGYVFHDWHQSNPTREDELERRRVQAQKQKEWRERRRQEKEESN